MCRLEQIASFLDQALEASSFGDDQNGLLINSPRPVRRLGLALEPWPGLGSWLRLAQLDAVFLHRPWGLDQALLPPATGVLAYHMAFDACLTSGFNPRLAAALGLRELEPLGSKAGRPLGMLGAAAAGSFASWQALVSQVFGGYEQARPCAGPIERSAVVGAMSAQLVAQAAARGAGLYLTGQYRRVADPVVSTSGIGVIAIGHRRVEAWGLRALAGLLRERWASLEVVLACQQPGSSAS